MVEISGDKKFLGSAIIKELLKNFWPPPKKNSCFFGGVGRNLHLQNGLSCHDWNKVKLWMFSYSDPLEEQKKIERPGCLTTKLFHCLGFLLHSDDDCCCCLSKTSKFRQCFAFAMFLVPSVQHLGNRLHRASTKFQKPAIQNLVRV